MCVCVSQPLGVALRGEQLEFAPRNSPLGAYQGPWLHFGMSQTPSERSKAEPALPKPRPHKKKSSAREAVGPPSPPAMPAPCTFEAARRCWPWLGVLLKQRQSPS